MLCCCPKEVVSLCPPASPHPPPSYRFHPRPSPTSAPGSDSKVCQQNLLTQQNRRGKAASFLLPWQGPVNPTEALWNCSLKPSSPFLSATTVTDRFSHPPCGSRSAWEMAFSEAIKDCCMEQLLKEPSRGEMAQSTPSASDRHLWASGLQTCSRFNLFARAARARQFTIIVLTSERGTG